MIDNQEKLFPEDDLIHYGDKRHHRNLFLPKYLEKRSKDFRLHGEAQEKAYKIICKWADLEISGKLKEKKESKVKGEFITEVFGKALEFTLFSDNKEKWDIEPEYSVNGGTADAAIGLFKQNSKTLPKVLIEIKGPTVRLDHDRFNGRTPVQQCWDYLNSVPQCPWGIVTNIVSFRLYNRNNTPKAYQLFVLRDLKNEDKFRQFYYLFQREAYLPLYHGDIPRAESLLSDTGERKNEVGDELYQYYHQNRIELIKHLIHKPHNKTLEESIHISQKLLDRIIFVAFCENRDLLPQNSIYKAYNQLPPFTRVTNPRWQNFLDLFRSIDKGNKDQGIPPYNGGLFRQDDEVDNLHLDDKWTNFFNSIGKYDFRDEVNVDVLGHLFEKSISDIERIRSGGLFGETLDSNDKPKMQKSAERKRKGIYYTPPDFTSFITHNTIKKIINEKIEQEAKKEGLKKELIETAQPDKKYLRYWQKCLDLIRQIRIVDPACGSGAFLISAYDILEETYRDIIDQIVFHEESKNTTLYDNIPEFILHDNLYGVDLSPQAVEITQLALWIRSAEKGKSLTDLSNNIICGNSLVSDPSVNKQAMKWEDKFHDIFSREESGFDCVIGNPPWERIKLQEREFFDTSAPNIASAVNAATRRKLIDQLQKTNPELYNQYTDAKKYAEKTLEHVRKSDRYPLTQKGDTNTYAVFAELAYNIVAPNGRVGLLLPSGIATDNTTKDFFATLTNSKSLIGLYDFENKAAIFPDVHRSFKFCVLLFGGKQTQCDKSDFVFFARRMEEIQDKSRHISLTTEDIKLLNPNSQTCPIFRSNRDAEITKSIYGRVPVLIDKNRKEGGNQWGISFLRMFDQTNDAELFHTAEQLKTKKYRREGNIWIKGKKIFLPLYEAKMIQMYDHRAASITVKDENWFRQGQTATTTLVSHQNPEFTVEPRWWCEKSIVLDKSSNLSVPTLIAFKNVTSPTNQRTMIASFIPYVGVINSAPIILFDKTIKTTQQSCFLANLNSFILDYVVRQKIGNVNLNFFIIEQLPMFSPDFYLNSCPWNKKQTLENWISERVLKLTCTSNDMIPLAKSAGFKPPVHKWKTEDRINLMAELDAAYFILYQIKEDDLEYILSTFSITKNSEEGFLDTAGIKNQIFKHYNPLKKKISKG